MPPDSNQEPVPLDAEPTDEQPEVSISPKVAEPSQQSGFASAEGTVYPGIISLEPTTPEPTAPEVSPAPTVFDTTSTPVEANSGTMPPSQPEDSSSAVI